MSKLLEKVIAGDLSLFCKANLKLHKGKIRALKNRYAINEAVIMVENMRRSWDQKKMVRVLFMDVKGAFDYVFRVKLAQ